MSDSSSSDESDSSPRTAVDPASASKKRKSQPEIEVDLALPEPPSKKAKRALKKGKVLPVKPKSDDEDEDAAADGAAEGADGDDKKKKKKERSPYGVWIGNLRFFATKADLRTWLVDNSGGSITAADITRIHMPMSKKDKKGGDKKGPKGAADKDEPKTPGENKGFAYVDFATFETNVAAIALSESEMNGRKLLIKDAKSYEGRPEKTEEPAPVAADGTQPKGAAKGAEKEKRSTKVFVGNLSFQADEETLYAHFEKCGPIRWIKVATFEDTGKCKGYGWVNFEQHEAAAWAVKGFVKIKETIDSVEDFQEKSDDEDDKETEKVDAAQDDPSRVKTRKWWVNRLQGRELKIELAEDDDLRQKKRFGKGGRGGRRETGSREDNGGAAPRRSAPAPAKPSYGDANTVARLKGTAVKGEGKKTTFE